MGLKTVFNVSLCCLMLTSVIFSSGCLDDTGNPPKEPVDGVIDASDAFPLDPSESRDTDLDGVGDNADAFPNNPNENADSDNDGIGDNSDAFPNDASETTDSDGDGVGNNADAFPFDANETYDSDGDYNFELVVGDNGDVFPDDENETADTDGDGVGDNGDAFPNDSNETVDSDGDGVGDNSDVFPDDPSEWEDPDQDGLGSNYEVYWGTDPYDADTDDDGLSDFVETNTGVWESVNATGTDPLDSDTDDDGVMDGDETNTGIWLSTNQTGTDPLRSDTDGDGLSDSTETNTGLPVLEIDTAWVAPDGVNEPFEPEDIFIETDLKLNVVLIGGEISDEEEEELRDRIPTTYIPLDRQQSILANDEVPMGVEYSLDLSFIDAPDELYSDYNDFLNNSKSMEWKVEDYIDENGNYYVDDAFDEAFGDGDYSNVIVNGVDVYEAESWLYYNADSYEGMETLFDDYVLFFLLPDTDIWPYYYYANATETDTGEEFTLNNLVAYGDSYPLYFIDLMTPPPSILKGYGSEANRENNPPFWLVDSDEEAYDLLAEYIEESLQFIFVPSYIYTPEYQLEYWIDFIIIDATSDDSAIDNIEDYVDIPSIENALKVVVPYSALTFQTYTFDFEDESLEDLKEVYDETTEVYYNYGNCDSLHVIDSEAILPEADDLIFRPEGMVTIPVFIFVEDHCSVLDWSAAGRAQAYEDGSPFGIFIASGKTLLETKGLTQISVHEIGHVLGLHHPHDRFIGFDNDGNLDYETDWYWGQAGTPMTYLDELNNLYFDHFNRDTLDRGHILYLLNLTQYRLYEIWTILEEKGYTYDTLPWILQFHLFTLERDWNSAVTEFENGNYFDYYAPGSYSFDYALNAYNGAEAILNWTDDPYLEDYVPYRLIESGTDPNNPDTDEDGLNDGYETMTGVWLSGYDTGTNPVMADTDGDGFGDGYESNTGVWVDTTDTGTNPNNIDSDYDWIDDGEETESGTDPNNPDTDGDELLDGFEEMMGSDPLNVDTDGDGLNDGYEVLVWGSDPTLVDTDGDGFNDGIDYWPTFNFELTVLVYYYSVENTDFWNEDDVYFKIYIEDSETYVTDYVDNQDEYSVNYDFTYDVDDDLFWFHIAVQAWDFDGGDGSGDDYYDIDGQNEDLVQLDMYYYPWYGWVFGDTNEEYFFEGANYGYSVVSADGKKDRDYDYHDALVWLMVGWNIV